MSVMCGKGWSLVWVLKGVYVIKWWASVSNVWERLVVGLGIKRGVCYKMVGFSQ